MSSTEPPPTKAVGEGCSLESQCYSGLCSSPAPAGCGLCQQPRQPGESCGGAFDQCVRQGSCLNGICVLPGKKLGEACFVYGGFAECNDDLACSTSSAGGDGDGICSPRGKAGEACVPGNDKKHCVESVDCVGEVCIARLGDGEPCPNQPAYCQHDCLASGVCGVKPPLPTGLLEGVFCGEGYCGPGLYCTNMLVCTKETVHSAGQPCSFLNEGQTCEKGLYCGLPCNDASCTDTFCLRLPAAGEMCAVNLQCAEGTTCTGVDLTERNWGTCVTAGMEGQSCPCAVPFLCANGLCRVPGSLTCP